MSQRTAPSFTVCFGRVSICLPNANRFTECIRYFLHGTNTTGEFVWQRPLNLEGYYGTLYKISNCWDKKLFLICLWNQKEPFFYKYLITWSQTLSLHKRGGKLLLLMSSSNSQMSVYMKRNYVVINKFSQLWHHSFIHSLWTFQLTFLAEDTFPRCI